MEIEVSGILRNEMRHGAGSRHGGQAWRLGALFEDFAGDNANNYLATGDTQP
jgi:hypothetical protein